MAIKHVTEASEAALDSDWTGGTLTLVFQVSTILLKDVTAEMTEYD